MQLDFSLEENRELKGKLNKRLKPYGLEMMPNVKAEFHEKHDPDAPQAYVVYAKELKNPKEQYWIDVFSTGVYTIYDPHYWWKVKEKLKRLTKPKVTDKYDKKTSLEVQK